jgi:peptidoglycan/LPS O-acetylase OafA/YrhL
LLAVCLNPIVDHISNWVVKRYRWFAVGGLGVLLGCLLVRGSFFRETFRYSLQGLALFGIFLFVIGRPKSWLVRGLENPFLRLLGRRSYAMYLIHLCVIHAVSEKIGLKMPYVVILSAPIIFAYSTAMWYFVEKPISGLKKKLSGSTYAIHADALNPGIAS